jgi:hypothetical protein
MSFELPNDPPGLPHHSCLVIMGQCSESWLSIRARREFKIWGCCFYFTKRSSLCRSFKAHSDISLFLVSSAVEDQITPTWQGISRLEANIRQR